MTKLLLTGADVLVTHDDDGREIRDGAVFLRDGWIEQIGTRRELDAWIAEAPAERTPDRRFDLAGCVLMPGLINGHHHLYQTLTRSVGTAGGLVLFDWLKKLYPIWGRMDPEAVYLSAKLGLCELLLSGATTVADHLYMFPNGARLDDEIRAAAELGVRFHPTRGSMSVGESRGGLPPDRLVEDEDAILADCERVIDRFHDPAPGSMLRIGLAPCSPFSVSGELMRESARLARRHRHVRLHTHLGETIDEDRYCLEKFGMRPVDYAESVEWLGDDVWFAHMVHPSDGDIARMAHTCSGVCHCPSSNMILASGIAPIRQMVDAGVRVGLGVDGSASNDGNHLLGEARQTMLLQRVGWPGFESRADRMSAREALRLATRGGASILGRDELGSLEAGKAADLVAFRVDGLQHAGGQSDPVASLLTCAPASAWLSVINGRVVVEDGRIVGVDLRDLVARHNRAAAKLL
ncbi:8-oxoguanine deaminase [Solimonas variicoloris]|uniref:8-oxoguanine deaminase n=1 Tax=Solimonas variicoloris TaxID=254408 RepID=UPI0003642856|nr:8-oxoguanine deaminase [Solimonas variicoloris]